MLSKNAMHNLKKHLNNVYDLEPNNLYNSFLTYCYKKCTYPLKVMSFLYILPLACVITIFVYFFIGKHIMVALANFLQKIL